MKRKPPLLSDPSHELLDYLELCAIGNPDRNASSAQLRTDLEISGSQDAIDEGEIYSETPDEKLDGVIDAVFTEAECRITACSEPNYPFKLEKKVLLNTDPDSVHVYSFLLLLSQLGEDTVEDADGAKLFEDVCCSAAASYFGCRDRLAETHVFGFPRRLGPRNFPDALEDLCINRLQEGRPDRKFPSAEKMKDAGLDIVAWRPFPDNRSSKLIAFGQCATGKNWWGKRNELQPDGWCKTWLQKQPMVVPAKVFFIPHAVSQDDWERLGYQAGIIFDRFRIAHFAENSIPEELRRKLQKWSRAALGN